MEISSVLDRQVELPVSKSIAARVLIINALRHCCAKDYDVATNELTEKSDNHNPSAINCLGNQRFQNFRLFLETVLQQACCDDTDVMARALASDSECIDVGAAGTAMRFLTAYYACQEGRTVTLDGSERMRQRPIGQLVDALRQMGASIEYLGDEGFPPLRIKGRELHGGHITMRGDVSSQFVSAVLMIAPLAGGVTLSLEDDIVSRPYIDMTLALMRHYGIEACWHGDVIDVPNSDRSGNAAVVGGQGSPCPYIIEGDWSAASYWFGLKVLLPGSRITLFPLRQDSIQGDRAIVEMMAPLGVKTQFMDGDRVLLFSDETDGVAKSPCKQQTAELSESYDLCDSVPTMTRYERDMSGTPDLVPTMAVTLCLLRMPFRLTGVATLRIKESDRLESLRVELDKLGYSLEVGDNSLSYNGNHAEIKGEVTLNPHDDHRLAMALSLAATRHKIIMQNAEVVAKSYPDFWKSLMNNA
ncbi:MAG: 3-phosphoshikimate 1-carboxyvinyltransferase [Muribaculaceae bacterium]|nr:3-phosphoshikimate 1-carboxyvinyltransferase [Muribaculaceae bacterium]